MIRVGRLSYLELSAQKLSSGQNVQCIGDHSNAGTLYFEPKIIWSVKNCRFKQYSEVMDADLPNPFSFNYDDVIFRVQTFKNS